MSLGCWASWDSLPAGPSNSRWSLSLRAQPGIRWKRTVLGGHQSSGFVKWDLLLYIDIYYMYICMVGLAVLGVLHMYIYICVYIYKKLLPHRICQNSILPPPRKKIEYILFFEDFRRSILEDPIPKNSAPPKTLGSHHGSPWFFPLQSRT